MVSIIVAYCRENRVIGKAGGLPWPTLPEDLKHFKRLTEHNTVIMGKNTWNSLPEKYRPLPNRINIVLSRSAKPSKRRRYYVCKDLESAIDLSSLTFPARKVYIIGGGQVFEESLQKGLVDEVIATEIHQTYDGDTHFLRLDSDWGKEVIREADEFDIISYKKG